MMRPYSFRLYRQQQDGQRKLVRRVERGHPDDLDALVEARKLCRNFIVEVFEGDRYVCRVKQGNEPSSIRDRRSG